MYQSQQLYRCGLGEHWRRQIGEINPTAFARHVGGCKDLIHRLERFAELDGHEGCVNTVSFNPTGDLLVSGSDDRDIIVWNWVAKEKSFSYDSGHEDNVFQARVMPFSDDRIIVSCAADGQVRYGTILDNGKVQTKNLAKHLGRAHKLAIEPGSPRIFYSCGEDGVVRHFDLREERSTKLFTCHHLRSVPRKPGRKVVRLNAIVMNPRNLNYFAVGGSDQYARVYDIRRVTANSSDDQPVDCFAPKHLMGPGQIHITCVAYSLQEELLVSYNDELIYSFEKSMGLGPSPLKKPEDDGDKVDGDKVGPEPDVPEPQVYTGHRNSKTVKGVNFFGPNMEYVVSGSDCGRIFIWKKKGGELVALMKGDSSVVNCLEPHPFATVLATSGIDDSIKIWAPTADRILPLPEDAEMVMKNNRMKRESHPRLSLTPDVIRHLLRLRHLQAQSSENESGYMRVSFEDGTVEEEEDVMDSDLDDDDDDSLEDGESGNPHKVQKMKRPKNKEQMWNAVQAAWESIPMEMLDKLVASMPKRIQAVIDARGGSTQW